MNPTDESYWAQYDGLQRAKHQLLRTYLGGWFPILSSWHGRVLYLDCHAGRGKHKTGHEGSPILALKLLLGHRFKRRILANTEVWFVFFERNQANFRMLQSEINELGNLHGNIKVAPFSSDYEKNLRSSIAGLQKEGVNLAPTFAFLDPYGFSLAMDLINDMLTFPRCELLINFMYRYIDMAIHQPSQSANMDSLFGCGDWRPLELIADPHTRAKNTISLFARQLSAKYVTHMHMRAANGALKYVLFHATNHRRGRELMKDAMWTVAPFGNFTAFERDSPDQMVLISPDPDLKPLRQSLWTTFAGSNLRIEQLYDWLVDQLYIKKHLHQVLREYRDRQTLTFSDYGERFSFKKNPLIMFPPEMPIDP